MSAKFTSKFDDGKDAGALRTIGEVSTALGIKTHVLRYWEQQFSALQPLKRSGRRYYRSEDIALLETIDQLVNRDGYTLKGAQQALKENKTAAVDHTPTDEASLSRNASAHVAAELAPELLAAGSVSGDQSVVPADVIAQLKSIRGRLAAAIA